MSEVKVGQFRLYENDEYKYVYRIDGIRKGICTLITIKVFKEPERNPVRNRIEWLEDHVKSDKIYVDILEEIKTL